MRRHYITPKIIIRIIRHHTLMADSTENIRMNLNEITDDSNASKQGGSSFSWPEESLNDGWDSDGN